MCLSDGHVVNHVFSDKFPSAFFLQTIHIAEVKRKRTMVPMQNVH